MENKPDTKKKSKASTSNTTVKDSSYGSMKTGTSSSSSLSISLFSESDVVPSTSGCSSEMATAAQSKLKKKERAKEFMKKLKSMLPHKEAVGKLDTLSTLERLVDSMRQLNEKDKRNGSEFKTPPPHCGSYTGPQFSESAMYIVVSPKSHIVQTASAALMENLGYPMDWWKCRVLKDFLKKKDINTVNSCLAQHSIDEDVSDPATPLSVRHSSKEGSKYFYARIRRFRKLGEGGFSLQNIVSHCPFRMMISTKFTEISDSEEEIAERYRRSLVIYCTPVSSSFIGPNILPDQRSFSLRHSLFCKYTYVDPNAVQLLGFLPQDLAGTQIFDLYHPDALPQLLKIHKKIMLSMGQPFKSEPMLLKTRNGCFVEVETEWSSFINPWSMQIEFIIGQHTVTKPPSRSDIFEDLLQRPDKIQICPDTSKMKDSILEVLKKPIQNVFAEPPPVSSQVKDRGMHNTSGNSASKTQTTTQSTVEYTEPEAADTKTVTPPTEKPKEETSTSDGKSTVIAEKGISSIYNQLNYSHNIKRFLMSHPKSFSNLSDEDSIMTRDNSEDEATNEDEELPLEIPVVKPPSCGSSTQVHVSEPAHTEEVASVVLPFGDETNNPPQSTQADNRLFLTEERLKKHTKLQERLYLQKISEEQPLLLNMGRVKRSKNASQKRPRPKEIGEEQDAAKHPCTNSGVFRSSSNIFMQSFPAVRDTDLTPVTTEVEPHIPQAELVNTGFIGRQAGQMGFQAYPPGYQTDCKLVFMQPVNVQQGPFMPAPPRPGLIPTQAETRTITQTDEMVKKTSYSDNNHSSMEDTTSSIMYLLEADSSTFEDSDNKHSLATSQPRRVPNKRTLEPPWLRGINWNSDTKMRYQMPEAKKLSTLKNDAKWLKQSQQSDMAYKTMEQLLHDDTDFGGPFDEEADFIFFPGDEALEMSDMALDDVEEIELTEPQWSIVGRIPEEVGDETPNNERGAERQVSDAIGKGTPRSSTGEQSKDVWSLSPYCEQEESYDTLVNSNSSEDEKSTSLVKAGGDVKEESTTIKEECNENKADQSTEENRDTVEMDTVIDCSNNTTNGADAGSVGSSSEKRGSSPKDGSLSGDDGSTSDGGQKVEMEDGQDAQSSCSKESSDLTPSEVRSNEEAGSSLKESETSMGKTGPSGSVPSPNFPTDRLVQDDKGQGSQRTRKSLADLEEIFQKLFVPFIVRASRGDGVSTVKDESKSRERENNRMVEKEGREASQGKAPWLVDAHLSQKVAMTYTVPSRKLEDVLTEDSRKMADLAQSATVRQQLLQLLGEVDLKLNTTNTSASMFKTSTATSTLPSKSFPPDTTRPSVSVKESSPSQISLDSNAQVCLSPTNSAWMTSSDAASTEVGSLLTSTTTLESLDTQKTLKANSLILQQATRRQNSVSFMPPGEDSTCISMESLAEQRLRKSLSPIDDDSSGVSAGRDSRMEYRPKKLCKRTVISDSNSDPIGEELMLTPSRSHSSATEGGATVRCDSSTSNERRYFGCNAVTMAQRIEVADNVSSQRATIANAAKVDFHLQERFEVLESSCRRGQRVEDIIMSKVFLSSDLVANVLNSGLGSSGTEAPVNSVFGSPGRPTEAPIGNGPDIME